MEPLVEMPTYVLRGIEVAMILKQHWKEHGM